VVDGNGCCIWILLSAVLLSTAHFVTKQTYEEKYF
jgi:hypothetical protein